MAAPESNIRGNFTPSTSASTMGTFSILREKVEDEVRSFGAGVGVGHPGLRVVEGDGFGEEHIAADDAVHAALEVGTRLAFILHDGVEVLEAGAGDLHLRDFDEANEVADLAVVAAGDRHADLDEIARRRGGRTPDRGWCRWCRYRRGSWPSTPLTVALT